MKNTQQRVATDANSSTPGSGAEHCREVLAAVRAMMAQYDIPEPRRSYKDPWGSCGSCPFSGQPHKPCAACEKGGRL